MNPELGAPVAPSPAPTVGFLGLGAMGLPIARRLLDAHVPLAVFNRTPARAEALAASGARVCRRPSEVGRAASSGVVFTMLSDIRAVRTVLFGRAGLARALAPGGLVVDLSTIAPSQTREVAERLAARGLALVDAPVGGTVDAAAEGRLLVYAGGAESDIARARPYLERFARGIEPMGPNGTGTAMKLLNNLNTLAHLALLGETVALAEGLGLARGRALDVLQEGGARSSMLEQKRGNLTERRYPAKFRLELARKDLRLVERSAADAGRSARLAREARRLYDEAAKLGHGEEDFSAVLEAALARARDAPASTSGAGT